ncbi:hypothetical protein E2I00_001255 [Balaenoptera physalus]|uniref:HSac2 domain-containing protein n=1 Tax=Balaenoptera physalus TaxID=9770 RepID=A0A643BTK8_BALPH|nr:hypothetical protein E2I00_001255 [Balaenoptera physalus]
MLLLLSNSAYYVAYYEDEVDKVNQYQRLGPEDLEKIEIGPEPTLFGKARFSCMRLHYRYKEASGYFHTLRAVVRSPVEDGKDTLQCTAEMLQITKQAMGLDVPKTERKLERQSSKPHEDIIGIRSQNQGSLAQGKKNLMSKFSSLNQKVKQTKSNINIGNLRKLGNFTKPEMKVNSLKPNLKVSTKDSAMKKDMGCFCQQLPSYQPSASVAYFVFTKLWILVNYNQGYDTVCEREKLGAGVCNLDPRNLVLSVHHYGMLDITI